MLTAVLNIFVCSQLAGLVETTHIVLRLLDSITKQEGALRVRHNILLFFHVNLTLNCVVMSRISPTLGAEVC